MIRNSENTFKLVFCGFFARLRWKLYWRSSALSIYRYPRDIHWIIDEISEMNTKKINISVFRRRKKEHFMNILFHSLLYTIVSTY